MQLWHRWNIWRAHRLYLRVAQMYPEARAMKARADELMRRHAQNPQHQLPLGDGYDRLV